MSDTDWWRGSNDGDDRRPNASLRDAVLQESGKEDNNELFDRMMIGVAALKLMRGAATHQQLGMVLAQMVADCELKIAASTAQLLELPDITTAEAKQLHFIGRVHAGIIGMLNRYVSDGSVAQDTFNDLGKSQNHG